MRELLTGKVTKSCRKVRNGEANFLAIFVEGLRDLCAQRLY